MIKSTIWLTIALAFRSLGQAGLLIVFARFGSPETLGNYSLALAITAPIFVLCEFGLRTVYLTHKENHPFTSYLRVRMVTLGLAILLTACIGFFLVQAITSILLLVSLLRAADSMGELYSAPLQRHSSLGTILVAFGSNALLTIGVGIAVLATTQNLLVVIASLVVVSTATTLFLMKRPTDQLLARTESAEGIRSGDTVNGHASVVKAGLPTGISWGLLSLLSSIPQYFLAYYFSQIEVGYFAIMLYLVVVVEIFLNAVSQSWIPAAKEMLNQAPSFFLGVLKTAALWTLAFMPVSSIACVAAFLMLPLVFGETYAVRWAELLPLFSALMSLPLVFFSAMALNVANSYVKALTTSVAAMLVAVGAAIVLIPQHGIPGALWVSFVGLASRAVFGFIALAIPDPKHTEKTQDRSSAVSISDV